jgi:flavin reductase (DIM6/NTAB) family NADH-FMN oxidoreductase RutF
VSDPFRPLKDAFGRYATGVAIAGCIGPSGAPVALTVNSFASVSLAPPLVLWCIEKKAAAYPAFMGAGAYAITVLRADQQAVSQRFSYRVPAPLAANEWTAWETGAPILNERLAAFDCRLRDRHSAGDHMILVGEVARFEAGQGAPLLYFASRYAAGPEAE